MSGSQNGLGRKSTSHATFGINLLGWVFGRARVVNFCQQRRDAGGINSARILCTWIFLPRFVVKFKKSKRKPHPKTPVQATSANYPHQHAGISRATFSLLSLAFSPKATTKQAVQKPCTGQLKNILVHGQNRRRFSFCGEQGRKLYLSGFVVFALCLRVFFGFGGQMTRTFFFQQDVLVLRWICLEVSDTHGVQNKSQTPTFSSERHGRVKTRTGQCGQVSRLRLLL